MIVAILSITAFLGLLLCTIAQVRLSQSAPLIEDDATSHVDL